MPDGPLRSSSMLLIFRPCKQQGNISYVSNAIAISPLETYPRQATPILPGNSIRPMHRIIRSRIPSERIHTLRHHPSMGFARRWNLRGIMAGTIKWPALTAILQKRSLIQKVPTVQINHISSSARHQPLTYRSVLNATKHLSILPRLTPAPRRPGADSIGRLRARGTPPITIM